MKKRIIYYDILKCTALLAVIMMHVIGNTINTFGLTGIYKNIYNIICNICYFAVPIFVMVSGALFLDPTKNIDINKIYKKYILRIILCILLFGLFYSGLEIYFNTKIINLSLVITSLKNIIIGNLWSHMWYLYLILGLYILTPIFRVISTKSTKKEYQYFMIILFIFTILISDLNNIFKTNIAFNILIINPYIFLYFLGDYLSRYEIPQNIRIINYIFTILSIIIIIINNLFEIFEPTLITYTCFLSFNITLTIFISFKKSKNIFKDKLNLAITNISECTLGIYLIHQFFINIIYKLLKIDIILEYPCICLIAYSIIIFIISYLITKLLRKINIIKKYIL